MSRERARSDCSYTWTGKVFVKIKKFFFQEQTDMDCLNQQLQRDGVLITIVQKYFRSGTVTVKLSLNQQLLLDRVLITIVQKYFTTVTITVKLKPRLLKNNCCRAIKHFK
jgi:hypothetical protein